MSGTMDYRDPRDVALGFHQEVFGPLEEERLKFAYGQFWSYEPDGKHEAVDVETMKSVILRWAHDKPIKRTTSFLNMASKQLEALVSYRRYSSFGWTGKAPEATRGHRMVAMTNGLVDLEVLTGRAEGPVVVEHTPQWFSPVQLEYAYQEGAGCPLWLGFLESAMERDQERIELLQEWFGYCLTTDVSLQKAMIWEGKGANGKTVAAEVLKAVVGQQNVSAIPLERFGERFGMHHLIGKLLNVSADAADPELFGEAILKQVIDGSTVTISRKYLADVDLTSAAKILVLTNNRPRFRDTSEGWWRRWIVVPWRVVVPEELRDPRLVLSHEPGWPFREELPGIFNWAVEGLKRLWRRKRFVQTKVTQETLEEFKTDCNPARKFLLSFCEEVPRAATPCMGLYQAYREWCEVSGCIPLNETHFGREVHRTFQEVRKGRRLVAGAARQYIYQGLQTVRTPTSL